MIVLILNSNEGKVWKMGVLETGKAMKHGFKKIKKKKIAHSYLQPWQSLG